jgi:hypothetical protein
MSEKYTKGPWIIKDDRIIEPHGLPIAEPCGYRDPDVEEANAALIAAAPDLLAALQDLELRATQATLASGIHPRKNHTDFLLGELGRMKDVALAAIAKAQGKA